jgi:hypothetical protein
MLVLNVGAVVVVGVAVTLRAMIVAVVRMRNMRCRFVTVRIADETGKSGGEALHR